MAGEGSSDEPLCCHHNGTPPYNNCAGTVDTLELILRHPLTREHPEVEDRGAAKWRSRFTAGRGATPAARELPSGAESLSTPRYALACFPDRLHEARFFIRRFLPLGRSRSSVRGDPRAVAVPKTLWIQGADVAHFLGCDLQSMPVLCPRPDERRAPWIRQTPSVASEWQQLPSRPGALIRRRYPWDAITAGRSLVGTDLPRRPAAQCSRTLIPKRSRALQPTRP